MLDIRVSQNLFAAIIFVLIGISALIFGSELDPGTSSEMGPGYLPRALGWAILLLGVATALYDRWKQSPIVGGINLRPLVCVLAACSVFSFAVESIGFILASGITVLISLFALDRPTILNAIGMITILPAMLALIFVVGIGLQFDLWWF